MIDIRTNAPEVGRVMRRLFRDQLPFATSKAINDTAKDFQRVQRAHQHRVFTVRRKSFVDRAVKIKPFASKRRLVATVRIDPPGGAKRADIIAKFEDQRVKRPRGSRLAVPVDVRRTGAGVVSKSLRPSALNLRSHGNRDVARGAKRTFAIREKGGRGGIFQRYGRRGNTKVRMLFSFIPRAPLTPDLHFARNARRTVRRTFDGHFARAFDRAVRTAR